MGQAVQIDVNCGIVVRGDVADIQDFKEIVERSGLNVVYTKISGRKLWIKEGQP